MKPSIENTIELQLQLWDGRRYIPVPDLKPSIPATDADKAIARALGRAWRMADPTRDLKPPRYRAPRTVAPCLRGARSVETIQADYVAWAIKQPNLTTVTVWAGTDTSKWLGFQFKRVTPEEFFAVTEEHDEPTELAEAA